MKGAREVMTGGGGDGHTPNLFVDSVYPYYLTIDPKYRWCGHEGKRTDLASWYANAPHSLVTTHSRFSFETFLRSRLQLDWRRFRAAAGCIRMV